ncbi:aromatic compound dioxygenase [Lactarius akahatsu]|uniref:Aromatic compound dioxygenase n=1 Tax=Lactarius akahatsu TaxID=416441 RepID=A0AAD4LJT7_9AGAM|nr:aromatic compound dioxygenase [Lactarius akahatsu]
MSPPEVRAAVSNGIPPPVLDLPYPDGAEVITSNILKLIELAPNPRVKFIFQNLVTKLHEFVNETRVTPEEWMTAIEFLTRTGQTCTPLRQEFILLSDVLGVSALVDALNNPPVGAATESSVLGPFFTEDAPDVPLGESIASEGKGEYLYVEGQVRTTSGAPIPGAVIETWETDDKGFYDTQYADRVVADCRGRLVTDKDGKYGYRAIVPVPYPIPGDGPVGDLLLALRRHNIRPNHLHMMIDAPGFRKLTTALYPEGDAYLPSDPVFGVKKSLVVKLVEINDEAEARKRGFSKGTKFKLLTFDFTLLNDAEAAAGRAERAK